MTTTPNPSGADDDSGALASADDIRSAADDNAPGVEIGLSDDSEGSTFEPEEDDEQQ